MQLLQYKALCSNRALQGRVVHGGTAVNDKCREYAPQSRTNKFGTRRVQNRESNKFTQQVKSNAPKRPLDRGKPISLLQLQIQQITPSKFLLDRGKPYQFAIASVEISQRWCGDIAFASVEISHLYGGFSRHIKNKKNGMHKLVKCIQVRYILPITVANCS